MEWKWRCARGRRGRGRGRGRKGARAVAARYRLQAELRAGGAANAAGEVEIRCACEGICAANEGQGRWSLEGDVAQGMLLDVCHEGIERREVVPHADRDRRIGAKPPDCTRRTARQSRYLEQIEPNPGHLASQRAVSPEPAD